MPCAANAERRCHSPAPVKGMIQEEKTMDLQSARRTLMIVSMLSIVASFVISIGLATTPIFAESSRAQDARPTPLPRTPVPVTPCPITPIPTLPPTLTPVTPPPTTPPSTPATSEGTPTPIATPIIILLPETGNQAFFPLEALRLASTAPSVAPVAALLSLGGAVVLRRRRRQH